MLRQDLFGVLFLHFVQKTQVIGRVSFQEIQLVEYGHAFWFRLTKGKNQHEQKVPVLEAHN